MAEFRGIYKCVVCDNVVEVVRSGIGTLVCCGEDMEKLEAKTVDEGKEKHVPVIEETDSGVLVKVGDVDHPMEENHYIKLIEVLTEDKVLRAELEPGQKPQAEFNIDIGEVVSAREYCTVHDLWENEL
ncbi:MAG: desulfoferrodoxin [Bacillota bacterium]